MAFGWGGTRSQETPFPAQLPSLTAEALDGSQVVLPDSALGNVVLLGFGFSHGARDVLARWMEPLIQAAEPRTDFRYYQVPLMGGGLARTFRGLINKQMRKGLPEARHGAVLRWRL